MQTIDIPPRIAYRERVGALHVHSNYSRDGTDSLEQLRASALERGIDFIALTDHAEDFAPETFDEFVNHCGRLSDDRVTLIPGLEFRFAGFTGLHLLALGLTRWIAPATPLEFIDMSAGAARLTIMAHPVLARYRVPEQVAAGIDAIEVWNAAYNTRYLPDPRAIRLLHQIRRTRPNVVGMAGLDQHDSRNDRETRVVTHAAEGDPLALLKAGHFTNRGRTMRLDPAVAMSAWALVLLTLARWIFDRVERVQDRLARMIRTR